MAKLSDIIEQMIKDMIEANNGTAEITRGELANRVNCVPSQITYVLSTRFTNGQGYIVESRRGGGGWIRIRRIDRFNDTASYVMHVLNSLSDQVSQQEADVYLKNFIDYEILDGEAAGLMQAAISDRALVRVDAAERKKVRMDILKNMLTELIVRL